MTMSAIPISDVSRQLLHTLAVQSGKSEQEILDQAVEHYRRKVFLDAVNAGYAELRADSKAWTEHLEERGAWNTALMDGLDAEEQWTEDGRCLDLEEKDS